MVLTIAAGNAALERWHARGEFKAGNEAVTELRWRTMPDDGTDSFAEVWIDAADRKTSAQDCIAARVARWPRERLDPP